MVIFYAPSVALIVQFSKSIEMLFDYVRAMWYYFQIELLISEKRGIFSEIKFYCLVT